MSHQSTRPNFEIGQLVFRENMRTITPDNVPECTWCVISDIQSFLCSSTFSNSIEEVYVYEVWQYDWHHSLSAYTLFRNSYSEFDAHLYGVDKSMIKQSDGSNGVLMEAVVRAQIPTQENQETINVVDPLKYYHRMQVQEWLLNKEYERQQRNVLRRPLVQLYYTNS